MCYANTQSTQQHACSALLCAGLARAFLQCGEVPSPLSADGSSTFSLSTREVNKVRAESSSEEIRGAGAEMSDNPTIINVHGLTQCGRV